MFNISFFKGLLPVAMMMIGAQLQSQGAGHSDAKTIGSILVAAEPAVEAAIEGNSNAGVMRRAMVAIRDTANAWLDANPQQPATAK